METGFSDANFNSKIFVVCHIFVVEEMGRNIK